MKTANLLALAFFLFFLAGCAATELNTRVATDSWTLEEFFGERVFISKKQNCISVGFYVKDNLYELVCPNQTAQNVFRSYSRKQVAELMKKAKDPASAKKSLDGKYQWVSECDNLRFF